MKRHVIAVHSVAVLLMVLLAVLAFTGCANLPADPTKMSPEQLREAAKDRSASAACTVVNSPWGVGRTIYVVLDQKTIPTGVVTVSADCTVTIQSETAAKTAPAARVAPSELSCYRSGAVIVCEPQR